MVARARRRRALRGPAPLPASRRRPRRRHRLARSLVCPHHGWRFSTATGRHDQASDVCLVRYAVRVTGEQIEIEPREDTMTTVTLIEGDGIGPGDRAPRPCARSRPRAATIAWERADAGAGAVAKHGDPLPQATIDSIKRNAARAQGPARDAERRRLSLGQRHAAPAVRPLRERAAGEDDRRRAVALHERRPRDRAREHRGPLRRRRALRRSAPHRRRVDRDHHAVRQRARDRVRVRVRAPRTAARGSRSSTRRTS